MGKGHLSASKDCIWSEDRELIMVHPAPYTFRGPLPCATSGEVTKNKKMSMRHLTRVVYHRVYNVF